MKYQETVPQQLGDFTIIRQIGSGSIGCVYLALQSSLQQRVALKIISSRHGLNSNGSREVNQLLSSLRKLEHPHIVPVREFGELGLLAYYTMECVEGPSLDQIIRRMKFHQATRHLDASVLPKDDSLAIDCPDWALHRFCIEAGGSKEENSFTNVSVPQAVVDKDASFHNYQAIATAVADLADAVGYAFNAGIVHHDIKPTNLLLSRDGRLQVVDISLARLLEKPGMTLSGELLGDASYMAPELFRSGSPPPDHRSDAYSLGAILYEWITLSIPFKDRPRKVATLHQSHVAPIAPRQIDPRIPRDLQTICLKALQEEPEKRYQTTEAFAADLRRFAESKAIKARPVGVISKQVKWHKKHWAYSASVLLAGVLIGTFATYSYRDYSSSQAEEQKFLNASIDGASVIAYTGNPQETRLWIEAVDRLGAQPWIAKMLNGQRALFAGQAAEAVTELEQGLALNPEALEIRALLARAYLEAGHREASTDLELGLLKAVPTTLRERLFLGAWMSKIDQQRGYAVLKPAYDSAPWSNELASLAFSEALWRRAQDTRSAADCAEAIQLALLTSQVCPTNSHARAMEFRAALVAHVALRESNETVSIEAPRDVLGLQMTTLNAAQLYERAMKLLGQLDSDFPEAQATGVAWAWKGFCEHSPEERMKAYRTALAQFEKRHVAAASLLRNAFALELVLSGDILSAQQQLDALTSSNASDIEILSAVLLAAGSEGIDDALAAQRRIPEPVRGIAAIHRPAGLLMLGKADEARVQFAELESAKETPLYRNGWLQQIVRYGRGELTEAELVGAMDKPTISHFNRSEGYFLVAMHGLASGDRDQAKKHFEECIQAGVFTSREYHISRFMLGMFRKDPSWPGWIPEAD